MNNKKLAEIDKKLASIDDPDLNVHMQIWDRVTLTLECTIKNFGSENSEDDLILEDDFGQEITCTMDDIVKH